MKRFFDTASFWHQPIGANPVIDDESDALLKFMASRDDRGLYINLH